MTIWKGRVALLRIVFSNWQSSASRKRAGFPSRFLVDPHRDAFINFSDLRTIAAESIGGECICFRLTSVVFLLITP